MTHRPEPYNTLIDAETWAFIDETESWYPPDTIDFSIKRQRDIYDAMCRAFYTGHPEGIDVSNSVITASDHSIPIRHYSCAKSTIASGDCQLIYFHGGGFVVGGLQSHDDVCSEICATTGFNVTSIDYRLSPEHAHPAAFNDAVRSVRHLTANQDAPLLLCGDSAGGNLAACVAHALRGEPINIAGQVLIYPGLGGDMQTGSYLAHAKAPMLTTQDVRFYALIRSKGRAVSADPTLAPLHDSDFGNLPRTVVFSAECDPLSDDGRHYCEAITTAGGKAEWINEKGLVHGYLRARTNVPRARESFARIVSAISRLGNNASGRSTNT